MVKAILMSIKPEYLVNILNGKKTRELRKSVPKDFKGWVYLYCTKEKPYIDKRTLLLMNIPCFTGEQDLNGKVVARFWYDEHDYHPYTCLDYVEPAPTVEDEHNTRNIECGGGYLMNDEYLNKLCLTYDEMEKYGEGKDLFAWHIKNLEIFDKPMELNEFDKPMELKEFFRTNYVVDDGYFQRLKKAPQSWQYVYVKEQVCNFIGKFNNSIENIATDIEDAIMGVTK